MASPFDSDDTWRPRFAPPAIPPGPFAIDPGTTGRRWSAIADAVDDGTGIKTFRKISRGIGREPNEENLARYGVTDDEIRSAGLSAAGVMARGSIPTVARGLAVSKLSRCCLYSGCESNRESLSGDSGR